MDIEQIDMIISSFKMKVFNHKQVIEPSEKLILALQSEFLSLGTLKDTVSTYNIFWIFIIRFKLLKSGIFFISSSFFFWTIDWCNKNRTGQEMSEDHYPIYNTEIFQTLILLEIYLDHKEDWALKNWWFWTVVLEKTQESPLDNKIKSVNLKGNLPWISTARTDAETEALILWPHDVKRQLIGKDFDAGKDREQEEKGLIEVELVGAHH